MSSHTATTKEPRRVGQVVYLRPECLDEYKKCHAAVWPDVAAQIKDSNIADCKIYPFYSIFFVEIPRPTLFASFKYVGDDWDADMERMAANPKVQEWWEMTDRMQESAVPGATGSKAGLPWWKAAEEVFHLK